MSFFLNKKGKSSFNLSVNTTLILINIALFIVFLILDSTNLLSIREFVAINPSDILEGKRLWTFLTSMFMHGGIFHLFANMMTLFFVGSLTEKILGPKRYLGFYLIAGAFSSLFFVAAAYIFPELGGPAVGASGALFGVVGLLVLLTPDLPVYAMFIPIPIKLKYAGPGLLVLLWLISLGANINIGNTAHLGGLIIGVLYGIYLRINYRNKVKAISRHFS